MIERPDTVDSPSVLQTYGASTFNADADIDNYECRMCSTRFQRVELQPSGAVTWTQL